MKDSQKIESIIKAHESEIKGEVLAQEITFGTTSGYEKEWKINSEAVTMAVEKQ